MYQVAVNLETSKLSARHKNGFNWLVCDQIALLATKMQIKGLNIRQTVGVLVKGGKIAPIKSGRRTDTPLFFIIIIYFFHLFLHVNGYLIH